VIVSWDTTELNAGVSWTQLMVEEGELDCGHGLYDPVPAVASARCESCRAERGCQWERGFWVCHRCSRSKAERMVERMRYATAI
jgi:hypothetical protein